VSGGPEPCSAVEKLFAKIFLIFLFTFSFFEASEYVGEGLADFPTQLSGAVPLRLAT
jgi:hypothetical protein